MAELALRFGHGLFARFEVRSVRFLGRHTAVIRKVTVTGVGCSSALFRIAFDALLASSGEFLVVAAFSGTSGTLGSIAGIQIGLGLDAASFGDGADHSRIALCFGHVHARGSTLLRSLWLADAAFIQHRRTNHALMLGRTELIAIITATRFARTCRAWIIRRQRRNAASLRGHISIKLRITRVLSTTVTIDPNSQIHSAHAFNAGTRITA